METMKVVAKDSRLWDLCATATRACSRRLFFFPLDHQAAWRGWRQGVQRQHRHNYGPYTCCFCNRRTFLFGPAVAQSRWLLPPPLPSPLSSPLPDDGQRRAHLPARVNSLCVDVAIVPFPCAPSTSLLPGELFSPSLWSRSSPACMTGTFMGLTTTASVSIKDMNVTVIHICGLQRFQGRGYKAVRSTNVNLVRRRSGHGFQMRCTHVALEAVPLRMEQRQRGRLSPAMQASRNHHPTGILLTSSAGRLNACLTVIRDVES